jgi:heme exporter protein A
MLPALSFSGVRRRFGRLAVLTGVSGEVAAGQVLLVTGRNGSGKSTLLRCLAGLLLPDAGTIDYREGGRTLGIAERRRAIGLVAPDLALYGELTAGENLAFFSRLRGCEAGHGSALLGRLGLPADRPAAALSSGMRQRLRWAWALLHRPRLLLLDEPFQNLDAAGLEVTRSLLAEHLAPAPGDSAAPGLAVIANPVRLEVGDVAASLDLGG